MTDPVRPLAAVEAYWDAAAPTFDDEVDHGVGDPVAREAWRALLAGVVPADAPVVADLACGTGTLAELLAEAGHEVRALDVSAAMVERARAKTARFGERVRVDRADVSDPPIAVGSVDVVLARHIVWALPDPHAALRRWVGLVRPGGRLVLVEGVWGVEAADPGDAPPQPWRSGAPATEMAAYLDGLASVAGTTVHHLDDPAYWGRPVTDQRYLLVAKVADSISGR